MKPQSLPSPDMAEQDDEPAPADICTSAPGQRWRQFTSVNALLIEIPLALSLIAAALLATLPGPAWD